MPKFIVDSGFDITNTNWYACLHLDSDKNYNIHYFILEKKKTKFKESDRLVPKSAITKLKSNALAYLINRDEILKLKDDRFMGIVKDVRINNLTKISSKRMVKSNIEVKLQRLYNQLPKEHRLQYNSPNLNKVRPLIDEIVAEILTNKKVFNSYKNYTGTLEEIDYQNIQYYGHSKEDNYIDNNIKKLYSRISNEILKEFKNYKSEIYLSHQSEFLSNNIFKLNLKSKNNLTEEQKLKLGISLYKIATYYNFNSKSLIKRWYSSSKFSGNFNDYYSSVETKIKTIYNPLSTTEFIRTFENMGISQSKYGKLKNKYYFKKIITNRLLQSALDHIQYENERIEKEIVYNMSKDI